MYVSLTRDWEQKTIFLIGGGPSAKALNLQALRGSRFVTVAINDAIRHLPWASVAFSIDMLWMRNRRQELAAFQGEKLMAMPPGREPYADEAQIVRVGHYGVSPDPGLLYTGGNSGYAALGMALMRGARHIVLVGYDMNGRGGHWHAGYEWKCKWGVRQFPGWARSFAALAEYARAHGQMVVNVNPDSAIRCFPFTAFDNYFSTEHLHGCETVRRLRAFRSGRRVLRGAGVHRPEELQ